MAQLVLRDKTTGQEAEPFFPGPRLGDLAGMAKAIAIVALGFAIVAIILIPAGWWSDAASTLRSVLEALPLGNAVAETPKESGNPIFVAALAAVVVGLAIWGTSEWRKRSVHKYLYGGNTFVQIFAVGMLRTAVIFGGITLVPILGYIAAGTDLTEDPNNTFTGPVWPIVVVICWTAFTWVGLRRLVDREAQGGS
jgi:hypothetical protein